MSKKSYNTRNISLTILEQILNEGKHSHIVINEYLSMYSDLTKQDRAFINKIVSGTIENYIYIDYIINEVSKTKTNKMKKTILNILRLSVYQIRFLDSVPHSAACNEGVKLAKKRGFYNLSGFVNGVLRNITRQIDKIDLTLNKEEGARFLSVHYSFPMWMIKLWLNNYSFSEIEELCKASNDIVDTVIRTNQTKTNSDKLLSILKEKDIEVKKSKYLQYAFKISKYNRLTDIEEFRQGYFTVQDESSMLVAEIANPSENDFIIDVCAAPGGKTTHIAEKLNNTGMVISRDLTEKKIDLIKQNVDRLEIKNINIQQHDATKLDKSMIKKADIVLADVPCSGLGIIRKKPDIKYHLKEIQIKDLVHLQKEILNVVSEYVKVGGTLIYSTCTINSLENEENIKWFISKYDFELEDVESLVCEDLKNAVKYKGMIQLLPQEHNTDGFFIAKLRRMK